MIVEVIKKIFKGQRVGEVGGEWINYDNTPWAVMWLLTHAVGTMYIG